MYQEVHYTNRESGILFLRTLLSYVTVVCSVTWPVIASEVGSDLVLIQTSLLFAFKNANYHKNNLIYTTKARRSVSVSPSASLLFRGQVTEQSTVKWP